MGRLGLGPTSPSHQHCSTCIDKDLAMGDAPDKADIAAALDGQFPLTELDKKVLSQTDEEFEAHGWEELKKIIGAFTVMVNCTMFLTASLTSFRVCWLTQYRSE